jgi:DUF305 family protein family protein
MQEASEDDFPDNPAGGGAAVLAAAALAACGSTSTGSPATPATPAAASPSAAAAYNAAGFAFTGGIIRLEGQARALSGLVAAHTSMMSGHDWACMQHQYGHEFNGHWLDAATANRSAELALCRAELRAGASTQARHLAQAMLTGRQAQLAQLQRWHHTMDHTSEHAGHNGTET